jgi:hypothetical protein
MEVNNLEPKIEQIDTARLFVNQVEVLSKQLGEALKDIKDLKDKVSQMSTPTPPPQRQGPFRRGPCHHCGIMGHHIAVCRKRMAEQAGNQQAGNQGQPKN